jgi:Domain of unknown function (DUF1127)
MTDMATTIHTDAGSRSKPLSGLLDFLVAVGASIREGSEVETRYRALARMSPHDLADIGLSRSEIVQAAFIGDPFRPRR